MIWKFPKKTLFGVDNNISWAKGIQNKTGVWYKTNPKRKIICHKSRLAEKVFSQVEGDDNFHIFSPVARSNIVVLLIALSVNNSWTRVGLDVKTAFWNAPLNEIFNVFEPKGFGSQGSENHAYLLQKAMYGQKQLSHQWHKLMRTFLTFLWFKPTLAEPAL